ncbi:MAG TPA: PepSY-like domain-containing protein [Puia sp.]|nr:PepSY-like domain-containing protein [Puia sp.]
MNYAVITNASERSIKNVGKKLVFFIAGIFLMVTAAQAQFGSVPGVVTDSFKIKYPAAKSVTWRDNIGSFQATFKLDSSTYTAKYSKKGEWQSTEKKIRSGAIPAAVKDGLSKSKYADWRIGTVTERYLPGNKTIYIIFVSKSDINRKNLTFASDGQLLKDNLTL